MTAGRRRGSRQRLTRLAAGLARAACACSAMWAATATMTACSTMPSTAPAALAPPAASWDRALAEATRRVEVYDGAMRQADLRAALLTPRLRKAFLDDRARFHGAFAAQAQRDWIAMGNPDEGVDAPMRAGPPGDGDVLVFVAFYAADQKNRSLATRTSIWDVALVRGEDRVRPSGIDDVRWSPAVAEVFPFVDRFDDLYLVRFPGVVPGGAAVLAEGPLSLQVRSALADCVVGWTLSP